MQFEADEKKALLEFEIEEKKMQMQIQLEQLKKDNASLANNANNEPKAKPPKLPTFVEGKDDLDAYLQRSNALLHHKNGRKKIGQ